MSRPRRAPLQPWLAELVEGYGRAFIRRGRQPSTWAGYATVFADFGRWLEVHHVTQLRDLELTHVETWQDSMVGRWTASYQAVGAAAVKGLLKWCARHKLPMSDPMIAIMIDSPWVAPLAPRPIPRADLEVIMQALADPMPDLVFMRTRALFWALFSSGSRITAMLSLDRDSIRDGQARVIQKGRSWHTLVFSANAVQTIEDYLRIRRDRNEAMFIGHPIASRSYPGRRLSKIAAVLGWYRLADQLGIPRFSSHMIRHSTATAMLRNRVDSVIIAKHLGHKDLRIIANYAEVGLEQRREAVAELGR